MYLLHLDVWLQVHTQTGSQKPQLTATRLSKVIECRESSAVNRAHPIGEGATVPDPACP